MENNNSFQINDNWLFKKLENMDIAFITNTKQIQLGNDPLTPICIPHTWYEDGNGYEGAVIYTKKIMSDVLPGQRVFLQFEGADRWCRVYVNSEFVGEHKGGYAAFSFDITGEWECRKENEITVLLDNRSFDSISPLAGDFTVFGGLYRNVNLVVTDTNCFDRTYYGTDGVIVCTDMDENQNGQIDVKSYLLGELGGNLSIRYTCSDKDGEILLSAVAAVHSLREHNKLIVEKPICWNGIHSSYMYCLTVVLMRDNKEIDRVKKLIGFRKLNLDAETGFYLNGQHMKLNGVAKHQDFGEVFNATTKKHWEQDICDLKDIGANSVRLSHYQHPQKMYELCDETGLIVWAEIPFLKISKKSEFFDNACLQLKELILQNIHHPSICFWGVQNEIAMFAEDELSYQQVRELNDIVKHLDPTRISGSANLFCVRNDSELNHITDSVGYNIYFGWYYGEMKDNETFVEKFHNENPKVPFGITEYGVDCNLEFHSSQPKVKDYSEEFQALYHETVYPIFAAREYIWGTYVWNLYDFSSKIRNEGGVKYKNGKGLITYDRKIKKDAFYYYKAQWSEEPFVRIAESRYGNRVVGDMDVKVYSNQKKVTLLANGVEQEVTSETGIFIFPDVTIRQGENIVVAHSGVCRDQAIFTGVREPDASYVYIDKNPGLNVKNWFIDAVEEEKLFPTGKYSIRDTCRMIMESEKAMKAIEEVCPVLCDKLRDGNGAMPLERILNYMRGDISEEECKKINAVLIKIDK